MRSITPGFTNRILYVIIALLPFQSATAQSVGIGTTSPEPSARLRFKYLDAELNNLHEHLLTLFASSDNPAPNNCWVSIQSERNHTVSMHLYNAQGALLQHQLVGIMRGNNVFALSLANYPAGVYSLRFTWRDGTIKVMKVEKQ